MIESLFHCSRSIDCYAHISFFKTKNCLNDDPFISCNDRIGKILHNIFIYAVAIDTQVSEPWPMGLLFRYGTTFKGKNWLPSGSQFFPLRVVPIEKGGNYLHVSIISLESV